MTRTSTAPALGLLAPAAGRPFHPDEDRLVDQWQSQGLVDAVWVRDLPCLPDGDPDGGQGLDPFAYLAHLSGRGTRLDTTGTASVILGTRHPLVTARVAVGAQLHSGGHFVLGLGTGGKPGMAAALGVADRPLHALVREWETIHHALRGVVDRGLHFPLPDGYRPPPMWLASDDVAKWSAVGHLADGWLTFLTTPEAFQRRYAHLATTTTGLPTVGVRLDVRLLPDPDAPVTPCEPVRGVVTCSRPQLEEILAPWRDLPIDHLVLGLRGPDTLHTLQAVREAWQLPDRPAHREASRP